MGYAVPASVITLIFAVGLGSLSFLVLQDGELPVFPENQYWGPSSLQGKKEDTSIRSFQINVSDKVLTDFKTRLKLEVATLDERVADPHEGVGFTWGFHKKLLRKLQDHWLNKYDWRAREALLNKWPNFKTTIGGIEIHFQHVKPSTQVQKKYKKTKPILLLHGWPSSFVEYQKVIPQLLEPQGSDMNFEVVVASLPGFGFSGYPSRPGMGTPEIGQIMRALMLRLGHEKFYVAGEDWGSIIVSDMATMFKDNILGAHMTMCFSLHPRSLIKFGAALVLPKVFLEENEAALMVPVGKQVKNQIRETGYIHLQATKSETVGVGISYSPSGLAAYILEKYSFWTNDDWRTKDDGGIFPHYDMDMMLDNVMVHWFGKASTTFLRIYAEFLNPLVSSRVPLERVPATVPVSCLNFPHEPLSQPKWALEDKFQNLVRFSWAKEGGHFSAFELPDVLAADILTSFTQIDLQYETSKNKQK